MFRILSAKLKLFTFCRKKKETFLAFCQKNDLEAFFAFSKKEEKTSSILIKIDFFSHFNEENEICFASK